ncbi:MAG: PEP-CTERM sorting domain-containing protein [Bryobacteraceae bacterium]|nr:PEP-CTERM sorting domain-containing protein [Bryobacteraceae bacterium]
MNRFSITALRTMAVAAILFLAPAANAGTIALVPSTASVTEGSTFLIDVVASDLQLSGFDLGLTFNPARVSFGVADIAFGTALGSSLQIPTLGLDTLQLYEVSFADPSQLADNQTGSFKLATITLTALSPGIAVFSLSDYGLSDLSDPPYLITGTTLTGTEVTVNAASPPPASDVPEPSSLFLVLAGCGALICGRLRRN